MASGIWTSVSGSVAQANALDITSNNLANVNTLGFKKDSPTFKEYLSVVEREAAQTDIPHGPIKEKELYPLDGKDQSFVVMDSTYTDFKPGPLKVTQGPLDLALDGPGFFEVSTPSGVRYTRHGSFKVASDGLLVTTEGYPVLSSQSEGLASAQLASAVQPSQGGRPTQGGVAAEPILSPEVVSRFINLRDQNQSLSISENGELFSGETPIAKLSVAEFTDTRKLRKRENLTFENPDFANRAPASTQTKVRQGMLEGSNVNPVQEMTNLIKGNRLFEHGLKSLKTYSEMMGKESEVGKL